MLLIRVDPTIIKESSRQIQGTGDEVGALGGEVLFAAQIAPSYDGQFGPQVAAIGAEANARISAFASRLINLGERLYLKGQEFENTDHASATGLGNVRIGNMDRSAGFPRLLQWLTSPKVTFSLLTRYLMLGHLLRGRGVQLPLGLLIAVSLNNSYFWRGLTFPRIERPSWWPKWLFGQGNSKQFEQQPESVAESIDVETQPIPADGPTASNVLQNLGGCTYYVATRRNLNDWKRWPNAFEWDDAAKESDYIVSKEPVQGAIIVFERDTEYEYEGANGDLINTSTRYFDKDAGKYEDYGHVAYVEQVDKSYSGQLRIKISESVYNGKMGTSGTVPTTRWIVISNENQSNVSFIHGHK